MVARVTTAGAMSLPLGQPACRGDHAGSIEKIGAGSGMIRHGHSASDTAAARIFLGRDEELTALRRGLERAVAGRGSVFLVAGEPGIGKTELADRLAAEAEASAVWVLWGRAWEGEGAPAFWPWTRVIRAHLERAPDALAAQLGAVASHLAQVVPEIREQFPDVPAPPPLDSEQARFRLFDAMTTFLKVSARKQPLLVLLDDLHWADKPSLLLLQFLAREIGDSRLLVIGTYRDAEVTRGHPLAEILPALRRERTVERILLRGLSEPDVHSLAVALEGESIPEGLSRAIARETEGNPFFVQEIVRHLADEGILDRDGEPGTSAMRIEEMRLPESVREVIGRRLARLGEECAVLLTLASVVGSEFAQGMLERVADLAPEKLLTVLEEALSARVIEPVPGAIGRFRFVHALIRETLYEELGTLERNRLHRRVAGAMEGLYASDPEPHLSELAHHFLEALPGGDVDKAVDYARRAGDLASQQLAYEEAANHYTRALRSLELREEPAERLRCELLLKLGEACWAAGGYGKHFDSMREAAELAERLGAPELLARAALVRAGGSGFLIMPGDQGDVRLLETALVAQGDRDSALRAELMGQIAGLRVFKGDAPVTSSLAHSAIEMARRVGDKSGLVSVLRSTLWAGDFEAIVDQIDEVIRFAEEIGDTRSAVEGHVWKAGCYLDIGDIAAADHEIEIQERFAETTRHANDRWLANLIRAARAFLAGRFEEAESHLEGVESAGERRGSYFHVATFGIRSLLREHRGQLVENLPEMTAMLGRYPQVPLWRAARAAYRAGLGQMEEARDDLEILAANHFVDIPRNMMWRYVITRVCDVVIFLGDVPRAALLYDLLLPYGDRCAGAGTAPSRGSIARWLGSLATLLFHYDEAERHFEKALEMNERIRARIWVAHTQHDYARMLVARGAPEDRTKAAQLATAALVTARQAGMKPLEERVLALTHEAGLGSEVRSDEALAGAVSAPREAPAAMFLREGEYWTIAYEGKQLRLKDAKGLQYIAHLLRHEGEEFHAADLAAGADVTDSPRPDREAGATQGLGDAGELLDGQARAEYKQRLGDLGAELEEATRWGDLGRSAALREEIEFISDELSGAYGLGGRPRKAADTGERARKAVTSRIRDAIGRVGKEHSALSLHLANAIRTGSFCCYRPERSPGWSL
jgi:tetratricopeptide (TPR) repeat protein